MRDQDPYLKRGRLQHVLAALQVMAAAERPERKIKDWAFVLDRNDEESTNTKWSTVFQEHPEFFLVYQLRDDVDHKAALRVRYVLKTYDSKTGKEYSPPELAALPDKERGALTTKPLDSDQILGLVNVAIALHTRAIEDLTANRWLIAPILGFGGALVGGAVSPVVTFLMGIHK